MACAPGIVQVYDAFQENGTAYIVMEYLEGRIVLIDFGSARAFQHDLTQRHTRIVTLGYAAPEQYSEEARFGPYTDIFGLGATLYHALTGAPPPSAIDRLQSGRAPSFPAGLPAPLADAVRQALELRIADRPPTMTAFLDLMQKSSSTARAGHATPAGMSVSRVGLKPSALASAPNDDREALVALYQATNGSQWHRQEAWLSDEPLDTWFGVTVDKTGRVIKLDLTNNPTIGKHWSTRARFKRATAAHARS